jgi:hypothetical protein
MEFEHYTVVSGGFFPVKCSVCGIEYRVRPFGFGQFDTTEETHAEFAKFLKNFKCCKCNGSSCSK